MWYLQSVVDAALRFSLVAGKEMVVGRKDCDILITKDQSISRRHATVYLSEGSPGVVSLTDCKSKFGTDVNGKKMGASQKCELHHSDVITFGQGPATTRSRFKLTFEPLVFCCSAMSKQESSKVKQLAKALGAVVENSWSERCSHLIMTGITVTVKVVSALSSCKPVITPAWVSEATRCHQSSLPLPSPSSFQPDVVDTNIGCGAEDGAAVSFAPNYSRTALFRDRVFYFLSEKQYVRLKSCLLCAGATCQLVSSPGSLPLSTLVKTEATVLAVDHDLMKQTPLTEKKWVQQVYTFLESHDLRAVQDSEIGFALLYISAEEYCNPRAAPSFPMSSAPMAPPTLSQAPFTQPHSSHQHSLTHAHTLPFTQDTHSHTREQITVFAPDSVDQSQNMTMKIQSTSTGAGIQKVNETITSDKSSLNKGSLDKSSVSLHQIKTEDDRSSSNSSVHPGSKVMVPDKDKSRDKHPPCASESHEGTSTSATNRAAVKTTSRAGGKTASAAHPVQTSSVSHGDVSSVKNEPLDALFGDTDDAAGEVVGYQQTRREGEQGREGDGERGGVRVKDVEVEMEGDNRQGVNLERQSQDARDVAEGGSATSTSKRNRLKLKSPHQKTVEPVTEKTTGREQLKDRDVATEGGRERQNPCVTTPSMVESPTACDSQADEIGRERRNISTTLHSVAAKKQHLDGSPKNSSQVPHTTTCSSNPKATPSQSEALPPPSPSPTEGSIIVPCSFTPRTQDNAKRREPSLPNSQLLTFAFQGKRKKRTHASTSDEPSEVIESTSKKQRVHEEVGGGENGRKTSVDGESERGRKKRKEDGTVPADKNGSTVDAVSVSTGLFSGQRSTGTRRNKKSVYVAEDQNSKSSADRPYIMDGLPMLETCEAAVVQQPGLAQAAVIQRPDLAQGAVVQQPGLAQGAVVQQPSLAQPSLTQAAVVQHPGLAKGSVDVRTKNSISEDAAMDVQTLQEARVASTRQVSPRPPSPHPAVTPPSQRKPPPTPDPAMFLSTRKKHKSPRDGAPTTPARASSRAVSPFHLNTTQRTTTTTQTAYPPTTQGTGVCIATPFTALVTGGKRSKAIDRQNTAALWDDDDKDQMDGEDPLVGGRNEDAPKKVYRPVCDEDGFVCSRIRPRVQTSRVGRLAAFAGSQYTNCSENSDSGEKNGLQEDTPVAEIVYTRLVVSALGRRGRGKGGGEGGEEECDGGFGQERPQNGVKNFKKFRKVQHIGLGAIPRLVALKEYVPPTSRELQDWMEELENASEAPMAQEEESSQDLFRFSTSTTRMR